MAERRHRQARCRGGVLLAARRRPGRAQGPRRLPRRDAVRDWQGPVFILTHHPEDARPQEHVTFLSCDVGEALRIAVEAADGKNVEVHSADIGRQLLERGLIDRIDLHIAPVLLGDGIRLYDNPGGAPIKLHNLIGDDPHLEVDLRYAPVRP